MGIIQPKTYNEALRFFRCLKIKELVPELTGENVEEMYDFITENMYNKISVAGGMLSFTTSTGDIVKTIPVAVSTSYDQIALTALPFNVVNTTSGDSGCGCSGCSSNNNNNNNNNNG